MKKSIKLVLFGEHIILLNLLEKELRKIPHIQVGLKTTYEEDLIFYLGKNDVDFVLAGLSSTSTVEICKELSRRYVSLNFLLLSNDCSEGEYDVKILTEGVYEANYKSSMKDIIEEIEVIHNRNWVIDYSLVTG